jgi:hypothetical protein
MAMDAFSALKEIVAAVRYLHDVYMMAKNLEEKFADVLARLLAFEPLVASIQNDLQHFQEPGPLQALLRLRDAVLEAEGSTLHLKSETSNTKP